MRRQLLHSFVLTLTLAATACAHGERATAAATTATNAPATVEQAQAPAQTIQSFTQIDGADLNARLEAARQRARDARTPYWSASALDVRPGLAVDPTLHR